MRERNSQRNGPLFPDDSNAAAVYYLTNGFAVIPMEPRTKDPGRKGFQDERLTIDDIARLFPKGKPRNVGILNGAPSGNKHDVDLDCPEALLAAPILLPPTGYVFGRPSAPESHRIYQTDVPFDKAQRKLTDLDGSVLVELRGTGGLTVFPPSTHKETGERITWSQCTKPGKVSLAELQDAVAAVASAALLARHWPNRGSRQDAHMALAGGLLRRGWPRERVERFVEAVAVATRDEEVAKRVKDGVGQTLKKFEEGAEVTGWPTLERSLGTQGAEVVRQVRQWLGLRRESPPSRDQAPARQARRVVRPIGSYQPFPLDALPHPVDEFVRQGAQALGCDPAYLALPVLSVLASGIGNSRTIQLKRSWEEPSIIWTVVVGDSGTLKTPAYKKAVGGLFRLQKSLRHEHQERAAEYQDELEAHKEAKQKAKDGGDDPGPVPRPPVMRRVICSDTTIEKLAEILEDNPRGILLARDEASGWLRSFTRYKQQGASDLPNWLEMSQAGTITVDRKTSGRPMLFISRAAVSVTGGIQPGVLSRAFTSEFLESGLVARILMAMPPKRPKRWSEVEIAPEIEEAYNAVVERLLALKPDLDPEGGPQPCVLTMTAEAKKAWVGFYNAWGQEQSAADGEMAAALSKLEGYAARFALVHHVVTKVGRGEDDLVPIGLESIEAGVTLCRWFADESRRIYATLAESQEDRDARRLVEFIRARGGSITVKELQRSNDRRYPTASVAELALECLVNNGLAIWRERKASPKGGRPTRDCVLLDPPDETDDTDETDQTPPDDGGSKPRNPRGSPDETSGPPQTPPEKPQRNGVSSESSVSSGGVDQPKSSEAEKRRDGQGFRQRDEVSSGSRQSDNPGSGCPVGSNPHYRSADASSGGEATPPPTAQSNGDAAQWCLVASPDDLAGLVAAVEESALIGLDVETIGQTEDDRLDPRRGRVRLLSLDLDTIDGGRLTYLVDCAAVDPSPLWPALAGSQLVVHNAAFDLGFLTRLGFEPGTIHDTMLLSQVLHAGDNQKHKLGDCVQRELRRAVDKTEQRSDWSGTLTQEQLAYAANDAAVLVPLYLALQAKLKTAHLEGVAEMEQRCLPAIIWMAGKGVPCDRKTWQQLAARATDEAKQIQAELDRIGPKRPGYVGSIFDEEGGGQPWNWSSPAQVRDAFALVGCPVPDTSDETLAGIDHPLADAMRRFRDATKRCTSYGRKWLGHVAEDGRVYPGWLQCPTASGRMACSDPNMQNLPRGEYRRCIAAPPDRTLVKADYSQIELRIAAKVSGDESLQRAYRTGVDVHTQTARIVLGASEVTKEHRQLAKAINFGLLYGMGADHFRLYAKAKYGVTLTPEQAEEYRAAFFRAYPGLKRWHRSTPNGTIETRTLAGRRRLHVNRYTEKLNTPVQGTGADGLKLALALLWERRTQAPGAFPVLAVHDEIVVEADADKANEAAAWVKAAMLDAMTPLVAPVPVEVSVKIATTWAG